MRNITADGDGVYNSLKFSDTLISKNVSYEV